MAVQQINSSFQNDGNYCQLDLRDISGSGPVMRIETFRCSQPEGDYGRTSAGTGVASLAGDDHLSPMSNKVFRHVYSTGELSSPKITMEMREVFEEDGSFDVRVRDVDGESPSFGSTLISRAKPRPNNRYDISYELRIPNGEIERKELKSPLEAKVTEVISGLSDISSDPEKLGQIDRELPGNPLIATISWNGKKI